MRWILFAALGLSVFSPASAAEIPATVEHLRCEYRLDPLGIDVVQPRLSWEMRDTRRGAKQTAYQILVTSTPEKLAADEADLWDSGRVDTEQSTQIVYAGKPLQSRVHCCWKVRLWDAGGEPTVYSKPALWTMGLLKPEDVRAKWIGLDGPMTYPVPKGRPAVPLNFDGCSWVWAAEQGVNARENAPAGTRFFRKELTIPEGKTIERTRFLLTADDEFELWVNGQRVLIGNNWRSSQIVDITGKLVPGKNCLAIAATNTSAGPAGLVGKLVVEFDAGEPIVEKIDTSWKSGVQELPDWTSAKFDDSKWQPAVEVAKMGEAPWGAIPVADEKAKYYACPLFRTDFEVKGEIRRATLYGSALGVYRFYINGQPVGNDYFTPDWTDYHKRVYYNTYDVTELVKANVANAIGGVLGAGWYSGQICWAGQNIYGDRPRLFAQLEIELADGTIQTVSTDGTWKTAFGPYIEGEFLAGETYDARKEISGWASPGPMTVGWQPVAVTESIPAKLLAFPGVTVQDTGHFHPVKITEPKPDVYVFDLGQNFAGFARLKAQGPAGTKVVLRFAEMLNPDGTIYTTNLRGARAIDTYILKGEGEEVWQPRFTFHGFRYVEVTGYPGRPDKDAITGIAVNSKVPLEGQFECSSPMINRLYKNIVWTQRANYISVPTDCPQRDERLGWTGDAETFVRAATYNADVAAFFTKWLVDLDDAQETLHGAFPDVAPTLPGMGGGCAAWADAGTICPWTVYQVYNDERLLAKHYDAMVRWVEFCRHNSNGLLRPAAGYGDWLSINANTPTDVLATAYFAYSTKLTADAARVLGKQDDTRKYEELFQQIKAAFNKAYVAADGRIKGNTQTCYVLGLWFDLLPKELRPAATRYLIDDIKSRGMHLSTGFVGTSWLMPTLSATGNTPIAYKLLLNDTFPSWGYSIKHGATTIWERWDGWTAEHSFQDPGMNSFAHYSFGAVARWMFQSVAGIDMAQPGFQRLLIHPQPAEGLTWVKASYGSIHGRIATQWKTANGKLAVIVTIPANTTATVVLPTPNPAAVTESGKPIEQAEGVKVLGSSSGETRLEIGAGEYYFVVPWNKPV
ncbi:MAG: family 78 glycoside hydrolase catalytic domain [Thermoguttaceae bacterium]